MRMMLVPLLLLMLGATAFADDAFPINVYPCPKLSAPLTLDGKLDDPAWNDAPVVSGFTVFDGSDRLANPQTAFQIAWDDSNLYLGVRCNEPEIAKVNVMRYAHDEHAIFSSETIEFFVDPNHTHELYYQLAFNIAGSIHDSERDANVWNSNSKVATFVGDGFWSLEVAVPWEPMKAKPEAGKVIGFNVNRDRAQGTDKWMTWAKVQGGFHDPQRFAHLVLSGTPEMIGKLSSEFRRGGRTGPIVVYSTEGFAQTSYASLAAGAFADVEKLLADLEQERQKEQSPGAAAEMKRRLDEYGAQVAALKQQSTGKLNASEWTKLDMDLQTIALALSRLVWEARLAALLNGI